MMEKAIKKILSQKPLSGEDAGRIMILDLVAAYKHVQDGGSGDIILTDAEKAEIVAGLVNPSDIQRFNEFRDIHNFLMNAGPIYDGYYKTHEVYYLKLLHLLDRMMRAEEDYNQTYSRPIIMTEQRYVEFTHLDEKVPAGGIAVLRDITDTSKSHIDERGIYHDPYSAWRSFTAEKILAEHSEFIKITLYGIRDMLSECFARRKAVELIARFTKVPQVKNIIPAIDIQKTEALNAFMSNLINGIRRPNDPHLEAHLKSELRTLLLPIDIGSLEPEVKSITKARKKLSAPFIKNSSEAFIAMLKREQSND